MIDTIIKCNGLHENFLAPKLARWTEYGADDLPVPVDWASIMLDVVNEAPRVLTSQDLQQRLIDRTLKGESWSHYLMAGKLLAPLLHKKVFGGQMPTVEELHKKLIGLGYMVKLNYSEAEYAQVERFIDHNKDKTYPHFRLEYIFKKYGLQNRVTKTNYETPQFTYMRMAMAIAEDQPRSRRMHDVERLYTFLSGGRINAPTPNFVNLGTPLNGYASCCIYTNSDDVRSIGIGLHIAYTMTYMSAGCGTHLNTRSIGDPVRNGMIEHQGKLPYIRATKEMVGANLQNGRGGADTLTWQAFDPEGETLVALQNPMSVDTKKIRGIDYSMTVCKFLARFAARKEKLFRFNCFTAPDLYDALYSGNEALFEELYHKYEADPLFIKDYFNAREQVLLALNEAYETGRYYLTWADEMNRHTPFYDPIYASNLCVAPETQILTDKGYVEIQTVAGTKQNIWNGQEWSEVDVVKTGENQKLITVFTDAGHHLDCTPYHKFYVVDGYGLTPREVRAHELKVGDKLIKFDMPVVDGTQQLDKAYVNGFYSGDGCEAPQGQRIYLYGDKRALIQEFVSGEAWQHQPDHNRIYMHFNDLQQKYFVPGSDFTIGSRLEWLAGIADADGCIYRNNGNQQLVLVSTEFRFLRDIQRMLDTLGVVAKVKHVQKAGLYELPANNGTGDKALYDCKEAWRLIITSGDLQNLLDLGINFRRLNVEKHTPQRDARKFIKVNAVVDAGRVDDTYCFTEPKRHMGIFNGILTGQCQEIMLPQRAYEHMMDLYANKSVGFIKFVDDQGLTIELEAVWKVWVNNRGARKCIAAVELNPGEMFSLSEDKAPDRRVVEILERKYEPEVAMCNIGAIVPAVIESDEEYAEVAYYTLLMIDVCIHKAAYELPHIGFTSKARMNAGVGIMGLATYMAMNGYRYDDEEGKNALHRLFETHLYHLMNASIKLGEERGNAEWMHRTKYPEGYLPFDTAAKAVDTIHSQPLLRDWAPIRAKLIENKGMRFSCVVSHMPGESSSKASGQPNSLYPVRELVHTKTDNGIKSRFAAPMGDVWGDRYQIAWDLHWKDQVDLYALAQKFNDQGISADYWRRLPEGETVGSTEMLEHFFYMTKMGKKSRYYQNTLTSKKKRLDDGSEAYVEIYNTDGEEAADCGAGGCKM